MKLNLNYKELSLIAGILVAALLLMLYWLNGIAVEHPSSFVPELHLPSHQPGKSLQELITVIRQSIRF